MMAVSPGVGRYWGRAGREGGRASERERERAGERRERERVCLSLSLSFSLSLSLSLSFMYTFIICADQNVASDMLL